MQECDKYRKRENLASSWPVKYNLIISNTNFQIDLETILIVVARYTGIAGKYLGSF